MSMNSVKDVDEGYGDNVRDNDDDDDDDVDWIHNSCLNKVLSQLSYGSFTVGDSILVVLYCCYWNDLLQRGV